MKLINSDCIATMKAMPDNFIDAIVTDPPYELGFMGKSWDSSGVASLGHHWGGGKHAYEPKTEAAKFNQELVAHTVNLIKKLNPSKGWLMENPRAMLRKLPVVAGLTRRTVTYCTYGDSRMKPTDLWGEVPGWTHREPCKNGQGCHEAAPRGSSTGTQGLKGAKDRSRVPYELGKEILGAIESGQSA